MRFQVATGRVILGALFSGDGAEVFMDIVEDGGVGLCVLVLIFEVWMIGGAMLGVRRDDGVRYGALFSDGGAEVFMEVVDDDGVGLFVLVLSLEL